MTHRCHYDGDGVWDAWIRSGDELAVQLRRSRGARSGATPASQDQGRHQRRAALPDADFDWLYAGEGRPSIASERLIRASLLQILDSIRSERQLMEQMDYNRLFRWFVGLGIDNAVWVPTVFSKNRDRLLTTDMARRIMAAILAHREVAPLVSEDHFSVDGTMVKAWAWIKSFPMKERAASDGDEGPGDPPDSRVPPTSASDQTTAELDPMTRPTRRNRNAEVDFRGERQSNAPMLR